MKKSGSPIIIIRGTMNKNDVIVKALLFLLAFLPSVSHHARGLWCL